MFLSHTTIHKIAAVLLCAGLLSALVPHTAAAQLTSTNYQLDVNGVGETGVGTTDSTNFTTESNNGPDFVIDDIVPPTTPTDVATTSVGNTTVGIFWTASTDNIAVTSYEVYRDGVLIGTSASPGYGDSGLTASTAYSYEVVALDAAGNRSATSTPLTVTTTTTPATDSDGDGIPDDIETNNGTDPNDPNDPTSSGAGDDDGDGITNAVEAAICTAYPTLASCPDISPTDDSDGDGVPDVDEFLNGTDPTDPNDPVAQSSGGGGGNSSNDGDDAADEIQEDPTVDVGVAITGVDPSEKTAEVSGEVIAGAALSVYFIYSSNESSLECTSSLTRYNISGVKNQGDTFSYTISGLDPDTDYYTRLCGRNSRGELQAASAIHDFTTAGEQSEEIVEEPTVDPVEPGTDPTTPATEGAGDTEPADPSTDPSPEESNKASIEDRNDMLEQEMLEEHSIVYTNNGELFSVTQPFADGSAVTVTIMPDSVLDADGNPVGPDQELRIIISEHFLPLELLPESDLRATSLGGVIFSVRVIDQFGNEYTKFDPDLMLEIDIAWPEQQAVPQALGLYFLELGDAGWTRIPDAVFVGTTVAFSVDHLTLFGAWGVDSAPDFMPLENSFDQTGASGDSQDNGSKVMESGHAPCTVWFWFIPTPNCWPWWTWLVLFALVVALVGKAHHSLRR